MGLFWTGDKDPDKAVGSSDPFGCPLEVARIVLVVAAAVLALVVLL